MKPDNSTLQALKTEHGELHLFEAPDCPEAVVIVRKPRRADYNKFKDKASREDSKAVAVEGLLRDCAVYPARKELDALLDSYPALGDIFGNQVLDLAGAGMKVEAKKL